MIGTYDMPDLRPTNFLEFANRILNDEELALDYEWNKGRQALERPTEVDQLDLYCDLVTSEMHEKNYCNKNEGYDAPFGLNFGRFNGNGVIDRIIGNWIKFTDE